MPGKPAPLPGLALTWLAFAFCYMGAYFLSTALPTRLLWYYPLQHRFAWEVRPSGTAMDFYGRVLLSLACGGVGLALARAVLQRFPALASARMLHGLLVWVVGLLLLTGGLYVFLLLHRNPLPVPLPPGYVPR